MGVDGFLGSRNYAKALAAALQAPPIASKNPDTKRANADVVMSVLEKTPDASIVEAVKATEDPLCDVLMKYIYRGLSQPSASSATLFKWHAATLAKAGPSTVVRVMVDRKMV